jgi:hypothetical protein
MTVFDADADEPRAVQLLNPGGELGRPLALRLRARGRRSSGRSRRRLRALEMMTVTTQHHHRPGFLAMFAAEFPESSALLDDALARWMRALLRGHVDLLGSGGPGRKPV